MKKMKTIKTGGPLFRLANRRAMAVIKSVNPSLLDLVNSPPFEVTKAERDLILALIWPLKEYLRLRVQPIGGIPGDQGDVDALYKERAADYIKLHGLTTNGADDQWRRWAADNIVSHGGPIRNLDIFTGVGSVVREILFGASGRGLYGEITGLDHSQAMLHVAEAITRQMYGDLRTLKWVQGDATNLFDVEDHSFKTMSAVCGIGAIGFPRVLKVYEEALRVLDPNGLFFVTEMHRPVRNEPGIWPMFGRGGEFLQAAESLVWEEYTLPFALGELWGWVDPTPGEEVGPFTTFVDPAGNCWGWRIKSRRFKAMSWRGIPVMPYYWVILEKVPINQGQADSRRRVINSLELIG